MIWLLSCGSPDPLAPWPEDPAELVQVCEAERIEALATTCRVQAAAVLGREGRAEEGDAQCRRIPDGIWREECSFRLGEELAAGGWLVEGLAHCVQAGQFSRNCITHAVWRAPGGMLDMSQPVEGIEGDFKEMLQAADAALRDTDRNTRNEALAALSAKIGYSAYVGSGSADPAPSKLGRELGVSLRTGYAVEAARLLAIQGSFSPEAVQKAWKNGEGIHGEADSRSQQIGRYRTPRIAPQEEGIPRAFCFGGGSRLVGETQEEDLAIAALEAAFWLEDWPAEGFSEHLGSPSVRIRCTAAGLLAAATGKEGTEEWKASTGLEHPCVTWHLQRN
jgi:hypothetical protein